MSIELMKLPFSPEALEPHMSRETIYYHYEKHHRGYVDKLNACLKGSSDRGKSLEELILTTQGKKFRLAAQIWNHNFFWLGLSPKKQSPGDVKLIKMIEERFGGVTECTKQFKESALTLFGSGWVWLVYDITEDLLDLVNTSNADTPLIGNYIPLLNLDVWEHAYYIDYRNDREKFIDDFLNHLINWSFVENNLFHALQTQPQRRRA